MPSFSGIVELATAPAFVLCLLLLWLYLRAVRRSMAHTAGAGEPEAEPLPASPAGPPPRPLQIGDVAVPTDEDIRGVWHGAMRTAAVQIAAGLVYAVILAMTWWSLTGMPYQWHAISIIALFFAWPLVIVITLVVATSWRGIVLVVLGYVLIVGGAVAAMVAVSELTVSFAARVWYQVNWLGTLFALLFLARPIRAMGPLVAALMAAAVAGVFALNTQMEDRAVLEWVAEMATRLGLRGSTGGVVAGIVVYASGALVTALLCYAALRGLGRLYRRRWISDQSIQIDAVWLIFAAVHAPQQRWWIGPIALIAYKLVVLVGTWLLLRPRSAADVVAPRLLLLRVFSLGARSGRLFDAFTRLWRYTGSIHLIAGPDLATATVEPHEFLDFLAGRLQRRFITGRQMLERRLAESEVRRDPDGRFRVSSFYCHDDTWRMVLRRLARQSDAVMMDLRGFKASHKGCIHELNELMEMVPLRRVVLVVDGSTDEAFLRDVLHGGWAGLGATSPNRREAVPRVQLFRLDRAGEQDVARLVATMASVHALAGAATR